MIDTFWTRLRNQVVNLEGMWESRTREIYDQAIPVSYHRSRNSPVWILDNKLSWWTSRFSETTLKETLGTKKGEVIFLISRTYCLKARFSKPTFTPSRDSRCLMEEAVKALVKVAVKKEQRTRPVRIHRIPNKRANKDLGTLSPYLREDIERDKSAEVAMNLIACNQGDRLVKQVIDSAGHNASSLKTH